MIVQNDDQIYEEFGPPQGMLLLGDFPAMFALQELQSSYVNGDFMAAVLLAQTFSVFAWVKGGLPGQVIISQTNGTGTGRSWLCTDPSDGKFMTGLRATGRGGYALMSQSVITNGNWHRIGFVWDGLYRTLYIDGAEIVKDTKPEASLESAVGSLQLGARATLDTASFWFGLIDDIRIYNKVMTP